MALRKRECARNNTVGKVLIRRARIYMFYVDGREFGSILWRKCPILAVFWYFQYGNHSDPRFLSLPFCRAVLGLSYKRKKVVKKMDVKRGFGGFKHWGQFFCTWVVQYGKSEYAILFVGLLSTIHQNFSQVGRTMVRVLAFKKCSILSKIAFLTVCTGYMATDIRPGLPGFFGFSAGPINLCKKK